MTLLCRAGLTYCRTDNICMPHDGPNSISPSGAQEQELIEATGFRAFSTPAAGPTPAKDFSQENARKEQLMPFTYEYPRAALTVDCVVFGFDGEGLKLLLIERGLEPFKGRWALPGGFVGVEEELEDAARRELKEETGITAVVLEQFQTFGAVNRDPRERVVTVAYFALTRLEDHRPHAATDARQAVWFNCGELPKLAFDHQVVIQRALEHLRQRVRLEPVGFHLLSAKFTLTQLQCLYETVLGRDIDTRNFRKRVVAMELVVPLKRQFQRGRQRPAQLYRFDSKQYEKLKKAGFQFDL